MDYSRYQKPNPTEITYDYDVGLPYGDMPSQYLIDKFESTEDLNDGEGVYESYARSTIRDRSADPRTLNSDDVQTSFRSKSHLNVLHNGGRGEFNTPVHSEMFLGITDNDPRGITNEPDMRLMAEQAEARMRFIRFSSDADNKIHESVMSNKEAFEKSRIQTQLAMQPRLKIFSTSKDGRREGMRRQYSHKSLVDKTEDDMAIFRNNGMSFSDYITDNALNAQRETVKLSNRSIRESKWYHTNTTDHEFKVAQYGQQRRSGPNRSEQHIGNHSHERVADTAADKTVTNYRIAAVMKDMISITKEAKYDQNYGNSSTRTNHRQKLASRDLTSIMHNISNDVTMGKNESARSYKSASQKIIPHLMDVSEHSHRDAAHKALTAELMYSALKPGADLESIKYEIAMDRPSILIQDETRFGSNRANLPSISGLREETRAEVNGKSLNTANYSSLAKQVRGTANSREINPEHFGGVNKNSISFKTNKLNHRESNANDVVFDTDTQFYGNYGREQTIGNMGVEKFGVSRHIIRDGEMNSVSLMS